MGVSKTQSEKFFHQSFKSVSKETSIGKGLAGKKLKNFEGNMNNYEEYSDCKTQNKFLK